MRRPMLVKNFMTKDVTTLDPEMEILHAIRILREINISGAPILDEHGRLAGMLTERDCMRVALHAGYHGTPGGLVKDYMSVNPQFISPDESILELAQLFIDGRFHRYPVVDNGRLIGIISRRDVMRAIGKYYPH